MLEDGMITRDILLKIIFHSTSLTDDDSDLLPQIKSSNNSRGDNNNNNNKEDILSTTSTSILNPSINLGDLDSSLSSSSATTSTLEELYDLYSPYHNDQEFQPNNKDEEWFDKNNSFQ